MDALSGVFGAFGLSASAGLNAYIPLLMVALTARFTELLTLAEPWDALSSWWVIGLLAVLSLVEFFADKIPVVNHINDGIQTFIRPAAGALVFAATTEAVVDIHPVLAMAAGILVAGGVHAVKTVAVRPAVTATTGGAGNVPVSVGEDILATLLSILAIVLPIIIAAFIILAVTTVIWLIWRRSNRTMANP